MLKTFALRGREIPVTIYGPPGLERMMDEFSGTIGRLPFEVDLYELQPGEELGFKGYSVSAFDVDHRGRAFGFVVAEHDRPGHFDEQAARDLGVRAGPDFGILQRGGEVTSAGGETIRSEQVVGEARRGRRVVYTGDTAPCDATVEAARGADLLVHESTFGDDEADRAAETQHSTARQAAQIASDAGVDLLCLTHVSGRYFGKELREQAREVFPNTELPRDFDVVELPFPERGSPYLVKED
jgi:ribonuclease Z